MVIVNADIRKQLRLFRYGIVFRTVSYVGNDRRFEVDIQREFKRVAHVVLLVVGTVIDVRSHLYEIFRVVFQIVFQRAEIEIDRRTVNRAAAVKRLAHVIFRFGINLSARRRIRNSDIHSLRVTQKSRRYRTDFIHGTVLALLIGNGDMLFVCRNRRSRRILRERIRAQRGDIIAVQAADNARRISVRHQFVFGVESGIQLVFVGIVIFFVEHRGFRPVAEERKHGHVQRNARTACRFHLHESFHIHAVFERFVHILLIRFGKRDFQSYRGAASRLHRYGVAVLRAAARYGNHLRLRAGKKIAFLRNGGIAVRSVSFAYALGNHHGIDVVRNRLVADVVYGERHFVYARLVFVVAEFQLGFIHFGTVGVIGGNICRRGGGFRDVYKSRALLSYGIGQPVLVHHDVRGGHHQLVHALRNFRCGKRIVAEHAGISHVVADERRSARLVGRSHRSTGKSFVLLPGNGGKNFTAVRRDFGLDFQIGSRSPRGEIGHKRPRRLRFGDFQNARFACGKLFAFVLRKRAHRADVRAYRHGNVTGNVVINNDTRGALFFQSHAHFFFERGAAALYQHDFALIIFVRFHIIGRSADAGNGYVFEVVFRNVVAHRFQHVVHEALLRLRVGCGSLGEINDCAVVYHVRGFHAVYRSHGKRRFVRGRRTYRTGIGVGSQSVVTVLFRTHRSVVRVCGGSNQRNARGAHLIVHVRHFLFVHFAREAAARTERHVDYVHAQRYAIFQRRQQPRSFRARLRIGEHFHDGKLRVRRNARNRFVFARNHAGNVRAVFRTDGRHVRVFIGVVVRVRYLSAYVYVLRGKPYGIFRRGRAADFFRHRRKRERFVGCGEIIYGKRRMRIIETGIEHGDNNAVALIFRIRAVENTRIVHVYVVGNHLRFGGRIHVAHNQRGVGR